MSESCCPTGMGRRSRATGLVGKVLLAVRQVLRDSRPAARQGCCPVCGGRVEAAFFRCAECGHRLKRNCPECGKIVETGRERCPFCRSVLEPTGVRRSEARG